MNFPITDSLALEVIKGLVESKYGRKVIEGPTPIIVTDFNTIKTGWDDKQDDYVHYAVELIFANISGPNILQDSGNVPVIDFSLETERKIFSIHGVIFQYLNDAGWTCFNMTGYRFKLEPAA